MTPGSPYTGVIAIILMLTCLIFLLLNEDPSYKIAFAIGFLTLVTPMVIYKYLGLDKRRETELTNKHVQFSDVFPTRTKD